MRKILVIGGNRYFGKRLVNLLVENGDQVWVLNRGKAPHPFDERVKHLIADRTLESEMKAALGDLSFDLVYDQTCYSPNEARMACELFAEKTERYIFTSTQSVYLEQKGILRETDVDPFTEVVRLGSMDDFGYGVSKRLAEAYFFQNAKFPVVAVRIPIVLGPDDYTGRLEFHIERTEGQKPMVIGNLKAELCLISSEDAANFLFWIANQSFSGPINACSVGTLSIGELLGMVELAAGKKAIVHAKGDDADSSRLVGGDSRYLDNAKAIGMGFPFSDVRKWLPKLIDFYLARGPRKG